MKKTSSSTSSEASQQNSTIIIVHPSNVEGGCHIKEVHLLAIQKSRIALSIVFSIITGLLFLLCLKWSFKLRKSFLYTKVLNLEQATHFLVCNEDGTELIEKKVHINLRNWKSEIVEAKVGFKSRKLDYIYHTQTEQIPNSQQDEENIIQNIESEQQYFKAIEYPLSEIPLAKMSEQKSLDQQQVIELRNEYGVCEKQIEIPSIFEFLVHEMTSPFYFLQYASVIIWFMQNYVNFSIIIITVQFSISIFNYIMTRISLMKIQKMALTQHKVRVFRAGKSVEGELIDSKYLVCGDIIELKDKMTVPCDCLLIQGELLMNEVSLTGESIPIPKVSVNSNEKSAFNYESIDHKKYYLFDGTVIFSSKSANNQKVLGKVVRVGFTSFKGQILRSILYPRPTEFDFVKNSLYFFIGLGALLSIIYLARVPKMIELDISVLTYFYRLFDTLTWVLPPFLPIFQSLSLSFALMRLRVHNILGIAPQKTMIAGKITHMCFDKTGTLTTNGIEVNGYFDQSLTKMIENNKQQQSSDISDNIYYKLFATCHGTYLMNGELVGDMLDIEMLNYSKYTISNSDDVNIKFKVKHNDESLEVLQMFEFDSALQRMSVIVKDLKQNGKKYAFLKGAPERVKELCIPSSIPATFTDKLNKLSLKGFRILGLSYREVNESEDPSQMQRQELEQNLNFLGFLVLENKLKPDTAECIQRLKEGGVECKIISGDNPLTTLQTGMECNILDEQKKVYFIDAIPCQTKQKSQLTIQKVENENIETIHNQDDQARSFQIIEQFIINGDQIVITGKVLDYFEKVFQLLTGSETEIELSHYTHLFQKQNNNNKINPEQENLSKKMLEQNLILYCNLIVKANIFSRMRPEQKRRIIEILQSQHLKVGMIGDGANDCEAIKQGDIGISFASADAALTAPFSSGNDSIKCVELILADGRATLSNNVEIFRVIIIQNVLKFMGCMVMTEEAQNFGDFQFTYLSFFCGMPLMALLAVSRPKKKLTPHIPDDRFYNLPNQISIYSQIIIYSVSMIIGCAILKAQEWHTPTYTLEEFQGVKIFRKEGALNSIVFLMINLFYMSSGFSFYLSNPFKLRIYRNYLLIMFILAYSIYGILVIIRPEYQIPDFLIVEQLYDKYTFNGLILLVTLVACALVIVLEDFVIKRFIAFKEFAIQNYQNSSNVKIVIKN